MVRGISFLSPLSIALGDDPSTTYTLIMYKSISLVQIHRFKYLVDVSLFFLKVTLTVACPKSTSQIGSGYGAS